MPPTLPQGFGSVPRKLKPEPPGDPIQRMVNALEAIAERVAAPPLWNRVPIALTSGASRYDDTFDRDVYNTIMATVQAGELWVFFGASTSGCPDLRFTAGDTQQRAIPPNTYTFTWLAHGADTTACVYLGTV